MRADQTDEYAKGWNDAIDKLIIPQKTRDKIILFNKLKGELEEIYGEFDTIEIADDVPKEEKVSCGAFSFIRNKAQMEDGFFYYDTDGCEERTPICIGVLNKYLE